MSSYCLSWSIKEAYYNTMYMFLFVPTFLWHIIFWIQVCSYKILRHRSLLWIYNYLLLDMISLFQILLEYLTRHSNICGLNSFWYNLLCVVEAYRNNYTTMVQSFALTLTNIYRYRLIVKNKPITIQSIVSLIFIHLFIYLFPLILYIIQYMWLSTTIIETSGFSCNVDLSSLFNQLINLLFLLILPTCINIPIVIKTIQHVRSSQNAVQSVRRIHKRLTIQFITLYTIWFIFFLPQIIFMLSIFVSESDDLIAKLLDIAATLSDIIVITLFDRRFITAWNMSIRRILGFIKPVNRRVNPIVIQNIPLAQTRRV